MNSYLSVCIWLPYPGHFGWPHHNFHLVLSSVISTLSSHCSSPSIYLLTLSIHFVLSLPRIFASTPHCSISFEQFFHSPFIPYVQINPIHSSLYPIASTPAPHCLLTLLFDQYPSLKINVTLSYFFLGLACIMTASPRDKPVSLIHSLTSPCSAL